MKITVEDLEEGANIIEVTEGNKQQILQQFMRLNPFNIVITLKNTHTGYTVEAVNQKAMLLFGEPQKDIQVAHYLGDNWLALLPFINKEITEIVPVSLPNQELFLFYQQSMTLNKEQYIFLVLQKKLKVTETTHKDELTGLWNFRALQSQWHTLVEANEERSIALVIVDLNRFKKFNESLGKKQADYLLVMLSKRLKRLCTDTCELFRMNGDKFIYLVQYIHKPEMEAMMHQVFTFFDEPLLVEGHDYYLTASIGIATSGCTQQPKLDEMIHEAGQALSYVKKHERGYYRFYSKEIAQVSKNEALMEAHLRRAIELEELFVHFQPQKNLLTGRVDSFEALIRWQNRKFGFVSPGQFIPLAESSGLILPIGYWVLERVCQYMQEWQQQGYRPVRIAVNISPKQFRQDDFVENVQHLIKKYDIQPSLLELEITESSMMNAQETTQILKQLKRLGVYVSVDDFGTGYSSLSYLKKYPIDIIKIDQSFIADIKKDEKNEAIVIAIILLSHTLGLEVIAEGVEEQIQEQFLIEHHCQKVQGYYYNKPLPVEQVIVQYFQT